MNERCAWAVTGECAEPGVALMSMTIGEVEVATDLPTCEWHQLAAMRAAANTRLPEPVEFHVKYDGRDV